MAAKSAGMPCPDYNRLHEGFKVAYTEMARQYPCFGFYNDAKHWWWRACVQYLFVKVKPFYKYGTWCLFFYVETWEGLVIQLLYNLFCSAGGLWCASCAENYFYLGWDKAERWLYGLFCLISMYELIWLISAAIIIYYICYTNDAILLYENIFLMGKRFSPPVEYTNRQWRPFSNQKKYFHIIILHHLYNICNI